MPPLDLSRYEQTPGPDGVLRLRAQASAMPSMPPVRRPAEARCERTLQRDCELWLQHRGYLRATADNAERVFERPHMDYRGWYAHYPQARGNPLTADLVIYSRAGRYLAVELKVRTAYQPGQLEMIAAGAWVECRRLDDFAEMVTAWEQGE